MEQTWETLWDHAMAALNSLQGWFQPPNWTFGGGTALMLMCQHRLSRDVDLFLDDPQYLTALSPRLNDQVETLTGKYVEQSNFLKLIFPKGEIDFIVAPNLTKNPFTTRTVRGIEAKVETPIEIVAKKVFYRPEAFAIRDIFDLAFILDRFPQQVIDNEDIIRVKQAVLVKRLRILSNRGTYIDQARSVIDPLPRGAQYMECALDKVLEFFNVER